VEVAIVNWNTAALSLAAAESFLASAGVRPTVTIVDNRSRADERLVLRKQARRLRLLLSDRNRGYGGAANLALDGESDLVCISNGDLLPEATALARLAEAALSDREIGMVGPVFEGGTQHYHARLPGPGILLARILVGSLGVRRHRAPPPGQRAVVGQVSGACTVMRRELWERVGGFDDGFFLWYDDVDLAKRLVDLGHRNVIVGSAVVRHRGAGSFAQVEPSTAQAIRLASLERYIRKHHRRWMPAARPLLWASRAVRARNPGPLYEESRPAPTGLARSEAAGGLARGHESHPAMAGEMLEVARDEVP
jgi:N-acetylglucosaminyl-diphospho-decaprenol L-rhamnosyltransferase